MGHLHARGCGPEAAQVTKPPLDMSAAEAEAFERFWKRYPRKIQKGVARRAWVGARRKASVAEIIAGLERYSFAPNPLLQPHPSTWLNQERWADEEIVDRADRWGLCAWYAARRDPGWTLDGYMELLEVLNVPDHWHPPDIDVVGAWASDGYKHSSVLEILRELRLTEPVRYLHRFDSLVRRRAFRWDPGRLEYVRAG